MTDPQRYESFLALHQPGSPLLLANAWDVGSARLLAACGFRALATTSSGYTARSRIGAAAAQEAFGI